MKILLLGATGQLGSELLPRLTQIGEVLYPTHKDLDASLSSALLPFISNAMPEVIVNTVSYKDVDQAEDFRNFRIVRDLNVALPSTLGTWCKHNNATLIHFSTDYVFEGTKKTPHTELDCTFPLNVYGTSKLDGEEDLAKTPTVIIRTAGLYKMWHMNFVTSIVSQAELNRPIKVVSDQIGNITWAPNLAEATCEVIKKTRRGDLNKLPRTFHATNSGSASRYQVACEIVKLMNSTSEVIPVTTQSLRENTKRPQNSSLSCAQLETSLGIKFPPWQESLKTAIEQVFKQ